MKKNKRKRVPPLQFGKFTIKGWSCIGHDCWRRNIADYTEPYHHHVGYIEIVFSTDKYWDFDIYHHVISDMFYKMYNLPKPPPSWFRSHCKTFNHLEEGKKFIDTFLNKLVKMKAFL